MFSQFSHREHKQFWTICLVILAMLSLWLLFAPNGVIRYYRLQNEIAVVKAEAASLDEQNQALATEVRRLQKDPAYLEDVAREEYGLIRQNEMIFDFSRHSEKH
ncbi:MAG: septum formation initiator family protein [Desulfobulbaceae bacterium]|nr:septum formation initiator family protein [Desulfobulbaceae bacterium]